MNDERQTALNDARQVIEWLEAHPDIPLPYGIGDVVIYSMDSKDEAANLARAFGTCEKSSDDQFFRLKKHIGTASIEAVFTRSNVCERVVVGTKEVETEEADPAAVAALPKVKVRKQIEIVEWQCPELLNTKEILP